MKYAFLTSIISVFMLTSCEKKIEKEVHITPEVMDSLYNHVYAGVLPCPDCDGIETYINIYKDSTISRYIYYRNKNRLPELKIGTWTRTDSIFTAQFDREKLFYKLKNGKTILRVGADFKEIKGDLAPQYTFTLTSPITANDLVGEFILGDSLQKHQRLVISKTAKKDVMQLNFSLQNSQDSLICEKKLLSKFTKQKSLATDLSKLSDSLSGQLKVLFTMQEAHVFYEDLSGTPPLFCPIDSIFNPVGTYRYIKK